MPEDITPHFSEIFDRPSHLDPDDYALIYDEYERDIARAPHSGADFMALEHRVQIRVLTRRVQMLRRLWSMTLNLLNEQIAANARR